MKLSKSCLRRREPRLANDDRDAAEQAAVIIIGKWSDPEDQGDSQLTRKPS